MQYSAKVALFVGIEGWCVALFAVIIALGMLAGLSVVAIRKFSK